MPGGASRAQRPGSGQVLSELVGDISRIQVRKDQHVGLPGDAAWLAELDSCDTFNESGISLEFTVNGELRSALDGEFGGLCHFPGQFVLATPPGRKRQKGNSGLLTKQRLGSRGGSKRYIREFFPVGGNRHRTVGVDQCLLATLFTSGQQH